MTRSMVALLFLSSLALAAPASAGTRVGGTSFTLDAGAVLFDHAEHLETGPSIGARIGYDFTKWFGVEGRFSFIDSRSTASTSTPQAQAFTYRVDSLAYLMPDSCFVPYLAAGGGVMSLRKHDGSGNQDALLLNYGLGAKYFLADSLALRLDARHLLSFDNNQHNHGEFSFGINYYFGEGAAAAKPASATGLPTAATVAPAPAAPVALVAIAPVPAPVPEPVKVESRAAASSETLLPPKQAPVQVQKGAPAQVAEPVALAPAAQPLQPAAAAAAVLTTEINGIAMGAKGLEITTSGAVCDYKVMTLTNPARISIDIYTGVNRTGTNKIAVNSRGVAGVRIGEYPYKTRVVLDFAGDKLPGYHVVRTGTGLRVLIDKPGKG